MAGNDDGELSVVIKKLGPLKDTKIALGDITLLVGAPSTGKSYTLRAIYTALSLLDKHLLYICKPRLQPSVNISEDGIVLISKLIAGSVVAAGNPNLAPSRIFNMFNVDISRYTVRERSTDTHDRRYIRIELRIKKESRRPLASFNVAKILNNLISSLRSCAEGSLIPRNSEFYVEEARSLTEHVESSGLGTIIMTLLRDIIIAIESCNINIEEVKIEAADVNGNLDPRGVEVAVEVSGKCQISKLEKAIQARLNEEATRSKIQHRISTTLTRQVYKVARRELRGIVGIDDILYVPFAKSMLLNLHLALGLSPTKAAKLLRLLHSRDTMYAAIFVSRLSNGIQRFIEHEDFAVPVLGYIAKVFVKGTLIRTKTNRLYYYDAEHDVAVPMHLASALASETLALLLALNSIKVGDGTTLILLEEPETQLHPRLQLAMGIVLAAMPSLLNVRLVATTHSDLLAFILAYINVYKPSPNVIAKILAEATALPRDNRHIKIIAEHAARFSSMMLHAYLLTGGKARPVSAKAVLEEMPSLSEASSIALNAMLEPEEAERRE